eukprot:scaffold25716_cov18-Prasinocladus_malaysianus.AAC.1
MQHGPIPRGKSVFPKLAIMCGQLSAALGALKALMLRQRHANDYAARDIGPAVATFRFSERIAYRVVLVQAGKVRALVHSNTPCSTDVLVLYTL